MTTPVAVEPVEANQRKYGPCGSRATVLYWLSNVAGNGCSIISFTVLSSSKYTGELHSPAMSYSVAGMILAWAFSGLLLAYRFMQCGRVDVARMSDIARKVLLGIHVGVFLFAFAAAVDARSRAMTCKLPLHAASRSVVGVSIIIGAARLGPHDTSALCVRCDGCSRRSTRAKPHAPPCAAADAASPRASAPHVSTSTRGGSAWPASCCARARARCVPCSEGAAETPDCNSTAAACHDDAGASCMRDALRMARSSHARGGRAGAARAGDQHTECMRVRAASTEEAASRHGKARRR